MKNAFYLMLRALFVLEIFTFLSWVLGVVEKRIDSKDKVSFQNLSCPQIGTKIITINTFPISQESKANQAMKFGQLIKYNMWNIFLGKAC